MKKFLVCFMIGMFLSSCSLLAHRHGPEGEYISESPIDVGGVGGLLDLVLPGAGAALAISGGIFGVKQNKGKNKLNRAIKGFMADEESSNETLEKHVNEQGGKI